MENQASASGLHKKRKPDKNLNLKLEQQSGYKQTRINLSARTQS